jgi:CspA family cold shock protein
LVWGFVVVAGRVVRFDNVRGYGFISPDGGGEDVFLHVNDLLVPEASVRSGVRVEFSVEEGDRGPKASDVRLAGGVAPVLGERFVQAGGAGADDDSMCDVLSVAQYSQELTEILLTAAPQLTGEQILQVRRAVVDHARSHGWAEG